MQNMLWPRIMVRILNARTMPNSIIGQRRRILLDFVLDSISADDENEEYLAADMMTDD